MSVCPKTLTRRRKRTRMAIAKLFTLQANAKREAVSAKASIFKQKQTSKKLHKYSNRKMVRIYK